VSRVAYACSGIVDKVSTNRTRVPQAERLKPGRGRRPAGEVRRAALGAAGELLLAEGLSGVTFAKVAALSGASKMTLYKWWPSPGVLAYEAYGEALEVPLAFPDTGNVRQDIAAQMRAFVRHLRRNGKVVAELIGAAQSDPDLAKALSAHYVKRRRHLAVDRLRLAQRRGEIRPDIDLEAVVDQLWGACYHRLLLPALPVTTKFVDALIDNVFAGIRVTSGGENPDLPAPLVRVRDPGGGLVEQRNGSSGDSSPRHGGHA